MAYSEIDNAVLDLPYSSIAFKASHNAYEIDKVSLGEQLDWDPQQPSQCGCRGIELDVHQEQVDSDSWRWSVSHGGSYDTNPEVQLSAYLRVVARWAADATKPHGPMLIHIDLKDAHFSDQKFADQIDRYLVTALPGVAFYRASELLGTATSLLEAVRASGWPSLRDLREKILVCLTGQNSARTDAYVTALMAKRDRICFCDREITDDLTLGTQVDPLHAPNRLILNFDTMSGACRMPKADSIIDRPHVLTRAYALPSSRWPEAVATGTNVLAMDVLKFGSQNVDPPLYAPTGNLPARRQAKVTKRARGAARVTGGKNG